MTGQTFSDFGIDVPSGASGEIDTLCPQCSHTRKKRNHRCLSVNVDLGTWTCHHCQWSGGIKQGATDDPLPYGAPLAKTWQPPRPVPDVVSPTTWQKAVAWFMERGIPEGVLARNQVAAAEEFCPVCERQAGHVLFPYYRDGVHVNTKHRCGKKHFRMEKGAERIFYGLDDVGGTDTVVIVEGEIDKLSCEVAGLTNALSVPDGAPAPGATNYASKFAFLESAEVLFARIRRVVLATDADEPGQALMDELARRIGPEKCSRVTWPEGIKDANEALVKVGAEFLRSCIDGAEMLPVEGIYTGFDLIPDLERMLAHDVDRGFEFGWPALNNHYRVKPGQMTVVTGIPSHGKSTVVDQLLIWLAQKHDWAFALFSPEQQPLSLHQRNLIEIFSGRSFRDEPKLTPTEMRAANAWVAERFSFVLPEVPDIARILELARIEVFRRGVRGVVVDPWNELEHSRPRHLSETEYISHALSQFRRFARHHDVHLWVIAHPTKMQKNADGTEPIPGLWDISGSAHFRNKADVGLTVWRNVAAEDNEVDLLITKMRWLDTGRPGRVRFRYDPVNKRLHEMGTVTGEMK